MAQHGTTNGTSNGDASTSPEPTRIKPGRRDSLHTLMNMQKALADAVLDPKSEPHQKACCASAWERLEDRKRILRGRPLPGVLKPASTVVARAGRYWQPIIDANPTPQLQDVTTTNPTTENPTTAPAASEKVEEPKPDTSRVNPTNDINQD
jgi:hypothetical protein